MVAGDGLGSPNGPVLARRAPRNEGDSPVAEQLRKTPKGQQKYDPDWYIEGRTKQILEECIPESIISCPIGLNLSELSLSSPNEKNSNSNADNGKSIDQSTNDRKPTTPADHSKPGVGVRAAKSLTSSLGQITKDTSRPRADRDAAISPRSTEAIEPKRSIISPILPQPDVALKRHEQSWKRESNLIIEAKVDMKERKWLSIPQQTKKQVLELKIKQEEKVKRETDVVDHAILRDKGDLQKRMNRQVLEHAQNRKIIDEKHKAAEAKKLEQLRQEEEREKLRLKLLADQIAELEQYPITVQEFLTEVQTSLDECPYSKHLPEFAARGMETLSMIKTQADATLEQARVSGPGPTDQLKVRLQELLAIAQTAKTNVEDAIDYARKAGQAEEEQLALKQQQEQQRTADEQAAATAAEVLNRAVSESAADDAEGGIMCVDPAAFQQYNLLLEELYNTLLAAKPLAEANDANLKKYRNDLRKFVTTNINAISSRSGAELTDKLRHLTSVLSGEEVQVGARRVSIRQHAAAATFVRNLMAEKFVDQGDEPISSKHESAFPIAAVMVGLWCLVPNLGSLFLAHLYRVCPYSVPYYIPPADGQSQEEYNKCLGYKYRDGKPEAQDKFLVRMSGYMRLYASVLVTEPPPGAANQRHPHGLAQAWAWIARTINMAPHPDITATLLYDVLQVTGHYLNKAYTTQFHKLLNTVLQSFLPKIRAVTSAGRMGPVTRLEICLEKWLKENLMPAPQGVVTNNFWFTKDDSDSIYYY